tara:strand:- start:17 stop:229 length:213 start_codon:yes stop_codon:yes gene_type:complete
MGKGSNIRPYNRFRFGQNYDKIFNKAVRKGMKAKATQIHKNKKKEEKKNPIDDWREDTVWAKKVADEFKS